MLFSAQRKTGQIDLEAVEMLVRSGMHRAGAAGLTAMLRVPAPAADERTVPCPCGEQALYQGLRSKHVLTALGKVEVTRPYYLCGHCHQGQFPADAQLDIERSELSPGVRRMLAVMGSSAPFDQGRQQVKLLAGLEITTKAVERTAEAIGEHVAQREQQAIQRAMQLDLPVLVGEPIPILYVQMDGTGVPVVKRETVGRKGKIDGQPAHTREVKLGCVFTQKGGMKKASLFAIQIPPPTLALSAPLMCGCADKARLSGDSFWSIGVISSIDRRTICRMVLARIKYRVAPPNAPVQRRRGATSAATGR